LQTWYVLSLQLLISCFQVLSTLLVTVFIQFGDTYMHDLAYYSGQFHQQGFGWNDREASRVVYIDETDVLELAYCNSETAWTISWKTAANPCEYIFKSEETETFDIIDIAGGSWLVKTEIGDVPVDWLKVICNDCDEELCKPEHGTCARDDSAGSTLNKCVCHEPLSWNDSRPVGLNCDLVAQCHYFAPDRRTTDLLTAIPGASFLTNLEFYDLGMFNETLDKSMTMHHQPIYWGWGENEADTDSTTLYLSAFMMFTGRRWALFAAPHSEQDAKFIEREEFMSFLRENDSANKPIQTMKNISLMYGNFEPVFFTMPVNYGGEFYGRQDGIPWVLTGKAEEFTVMSRHADDSQQLPVRYLCSDCVSGGYPSLVWYDVCTIHPAAVHIVLTPRVASLLGQWSNAEICQNDGYCDYSTGYCTCPWYTT
jgi:hypothetical protein